MGYQFTYLYAWSLTLPMLIGMIAVAVSCVEWFKDERGVARGIGKAGILGGLLGYPLAIAYHSLEAEFPYLPRMSTDLVILVSSAYALTAYVTFRGIRKAKQTVSMITQGSHAWSRNKVMANLLVLGMLLSLACSCSAFLRLSGLRAITGMQIAV